jgi:hypothetical protein
MLRHWIRVPLVTVDNFLLTLVPKTHLSHLIWLDICSCSKSQYYMSCESEQGLTYATASI